MFGLIFRVHNVRILTVLTCEVAKVVASVINSSLERGLDVMLVASLDVELDTVLGNYEVEVIRQSGTERIQTCGLQVRLQYGTVDWLCDGLTLMNFMQLTFP
jgi:hypothetical protein